MRRRLLLTSISVITFLLVFAPLALAEDFGEGKYGETNDKVTTNVGFIVIAFFPFIIVVFSLIQWRLEKRKDRRLAAKRHRAQAAEWRGGW
jgi:hypothetical protein